MLFVVLFSLISKDDVEKEAGAATETDLGGQRDLAENQEREEGFQPKEDDVD